MSDQGTSAQQRVKNLSLAAVAGQSGCATVVIIFVALFTGLWLDAQLGQNGLCVFGMLVLSIPFSLYVMLRITWSAISRITPPVMTPEPHDQQEEV
ncbi:MAG: hypothetical protein ACOCX5_04440 [Chloroflexota bacterium]